MKSLAKTQWDYKGFGIGIFSWFVFFWRVFVVFLFFLSLPLAPFSFMFAVIGSSLVAKIGHREIVLQQHSLNLANYTCIKRLNYFLAFCVSRRTSCGLEGRAPFQKWCSARSCADESDRKSKLESQLVVGNQHWTRQTYQSAFLPFLGMTLRLLLFQMWGKHSTNARGSTKVKWCACEEVQGCARALSSVLGIFFCFKEIALFAHPASRIYT